MRWCCSGYLSLGLTAVLALASAGCGEQGPVRYRLSGQVTAAGDAVPAGVIFFDPDASKGNSGPQGYAYIKDGQYDTDAEGLGSVGGALIARVQGFDGKPGEELPLGRMVYGEHEFAIELPRESGTKDFELPGIK